VRVHGATKNAHDLAQTDRPPNDSLLQNHLRWPERHKNPDTPSARCFRPSLKRHERGKRSAGWWQVFPAPRFFFTIFPSRETRTFPACQKILSTEKISELRMPWGNCTSKSNYRPQISLRAASFGAARGAGCGARPPFLQSRAKTAPHATRALQQAALG